MKIKFKAILVFLFLFGLFIGSVLYAEASENKKSSLLERDLAFMSVYNCSIDLLECIKVCPKTDYRKCEESCQFDCEVCTLDFGEGIEICLP